MTSVGAARVLHRDRLRDGVVGVAAEDDVDAGDAACELEVDVHAVVRQQDDGIDLVVAAQLHRHAACSSSSRMPKVQSGVNRFGCAIGT